MNIRQYYAIHVGARWGTAAAWGVMVESAGVRKLLSVGCTRPEAESFATRLNERGAKGAPRRAAVVLACLLGLLVAGCGSTAPLKGGKATTSQAAGSTVQTIAQGENPAAVSRQDQETVKVKTYTVPTGSRIEDFHVVAGETGALMTNVAAGVVSAPMPVVEREETRAKTELGAAQKDTARELGAKLASLKGIVWVGVALFVFGLASIFYPPLKVIIGSLTTSAAICAGGLALMVLPTLVVGNELLILAGVGVAVGGWFLAHRHGQLRGLVDSAGADLPISPDNSGKAGGL